MADEIEVSYTVKELLKQISDRIDSFMVLLASKADASSVAHAHERLDNLEPKVATIERTMTEKAKHLSARQEFRRWVVPVLISAATIGVLLIQVLPK